MSKAKRKALGAVQKNMSAIKGGIVFCLLQMLTLADKGGGLANTDMVYLVYLKVFGLGLAWYKMQTLSFALFRI